MHYCEYNLHAVDSPGITLTLRDPKLELIKGTVVQF